jgi:hypothetical protein
MQTERPETGLSAAARNRFVAREGRPPFVSDWRNAVMIHYEVDPDVLQREVPFELDLFDGRAFVTLVLFEMVGLRTHRCQRLGRWLFGPIGTHAFLNVRTYVRVGDETGIYFLAEYLPNRLSVLLGPATFGLPYRYGQIAFQAVDPRDARSRTTSADSASTDFTGRVCAGNREQCFEFRASLPSNACFGPTQSGSLSEFLMERYTAFTRWAGIDRRFRIWHHPWPQESIDVHVLNDSLLANTGEWSASAQIANANYSPGVSNVWMGRPRWLSNRSTDRRPIRTGRFASCPP